MTCLSDEELATPVATGDGRLAHLESCDACREVWLHAHDEDAGDAQPWTVGRYHVRGTLGAGGLGVVLLGWDPVLKREVAIKFPAARGGVLLREAQALAQIRHPNVVAVHDFGEVDGDVYFAMERVAGTPFDAWCWTASVAARLRALIDVAEGLAAIHAAELVHCDVKPDNIVVAGDKAVIVDLGLAMPSGGGAASGGTPGYIAPELEQGGAPNAASDEYAFWQVVRRALTGDRRVDALVTRGTNPDPAQRFGSLATCASELRSLLGSGRTRWIVGGVALVSAAALAVTVFAMRDSSKCRADLQPPSAATREKLAHVLSDRPEVLAKLLAFVERERASGNRVLAGACESEDAASLRSRWCARAGSRWISQHLVAIAAGRDVGSYLDELPMGIPAENCAPGRVTASPPAVEANATSASRKLLAELQSYEALPHAERLARLRALDVTSANNPALTASWHMDLAIVNQRLGKQRDALQSALAAVDVATRNGDDLVLARARATVYVLRDVPDRAATTSDAEAEAIIARAGSPGLIAMFHNAAGQRALAQGDVARARTLLEKSIATFESLELAPMMMRGSSEQNLGVALQFSRKMEDAQVHLDRAVSIFTARFGPSHDETLGARLAAASNAMYLGRVDDAARELDALAALQSAPTAVGARVAMARCQVAQVQKRDPLARCKDALATSRAVFGNSDVEIVPPLVAVAQLTMVTSVKAAVPLLEEAVALAEKHAGNPTDLPYARGLYALALKVTGRATEGEAIAKLALPELERLGQKELVATLRQHFAL
ncbi:MAG: serine/threonine protein kinase [Myxococcota bacterium]|nr:serine/threonine protein kinase [Myxococcota bacterium]